MKDEILKKNILIYLNQLRKFEFDNIDFGCDKRIYYIVNKYVFLNQNDYLSQSFKNHYEYSDSLKKLSQYCNLESEKPRAEKQLQCEIYNDRLFQFYLIRFKDQFHNFLINNKIEFKNQFNLNSIIEHIIIPNEVGRSIQKILKVHYDFNETNCQIAIIKLINNNSQRTLINLDKQNIINQIFNSHSGNYKLVNDDKILELFKFYFNKLKNKRLINYLLNKFSHLYYFSYNNIIIKVLRFNSKFKLQQDLHNENNLNDQVGLLIYEDYNVLSLFSLIQYNCLYLKLRLFKEILDYFNDAANLKRQLSNGFDQYIFDRFCNQLELNLELYYDSLWLKKKQNFKYGKIDKKQLVQYDESNESKCFIIITDQIKPINNPYIYSDKFNHPLFEKFFTKLIQSQQEDFKFKQSLERFIINKTPLHIVKKYPTLYQISQQDKNQINVNIQLKYLKSINQTCKIYNISKLVNLNSHSSFREQCKNLNLKYFRLCKFISSQCFKKSIDNLKYRNIPSQIDQKPDKLDLIVKHYEKNINLGHSNQSIKDMQYKFLMDTKLNLSYDWQRVMAKRQHQKSCISKHVNLNQDTELLRNERLIFVDCILNVVNILDQQECVFFDQTDSGDFEKKKMVPNQEKSVYFTNSKYIPSQNYSLLLAITKSGIVCWNILFENNNNVLNTNFLLKLIDILMNRINNGLDKKQVIIMDNRKVQAHGFAYNVITNYLRLHDGQFNIKILFLNSFSSEMNPIERINKVISIEGVKVFIHYLNQVKL